MYGWASVLRQLINLAVYSPSQHREYRVQSGSRRVPRETLGAGQDSGVASGDRCLSSRILPGPSANIRHTVSKRQQSSLDSGHGEVCNLWIGVASSVEHLQHPGANLGYGGVLARGASDELFLRVFQVLSVLLRVLGFVDGRPRAGAGPARFVGEAGRVYVASAVW